MRVRLKVLEYTVASKLCCTNAGTLLAGAEVENEHTSPPQPPPPPRQQHPAQTCIPSARAYTHHRGGKGKKKHTLSERYASAANNLRVAQNDYKVLIQMRDATCSTHARRTGPTVWQQVSVAPLVAFMQSSLAAGLPQQTKVSRRPDLQTTPPHTTAARTCTAAPSTATVDQENATTHNKAAVRAEPPAVTLFMVVEVM